MSKTNTFTQLQLLADSTKGMRYTKANRISVSQAVQTIGTDMLKGTAPKKPVKQMTIMDLHSTLNGLGYRCGPVVLLTALRRMYGDNGKRIFRQSRNNGTHPGKPYATLLEGQKALKQFWSESEMLPSKQKKPKTAIHPETGLIYFGEV